MPKRFEIFVTYDIEKDKTRNKISKRLMYFGLKRIQYSVFWGDVSEKDINEMKEYFKSIEYCGKDRVVITEVRLEDDKKTFQYGEKIKREKEYGIF